MRIYAEGAGGLAPNQLCKPHQTRSLELILLLIPLIAALAAAALIEVRLAAGADRGFPSLDDLGAFGPESATTVEVFRNCVFLAAIKEHERHGNIETILLDDSGARGRCRFEQVAFGVRDVVGVECGLGQDEIAGVNGIARLSLLTEQAGRVFGIELRLPRTGLRAIRRNDKSDREGDSNGGPFSRMPFCRRDDRDGGSEEAPAPPPIRRD